MKLLTFELAGKKRAKACKSIDDVIKLGAEIISIAENNKIDIFSDSTLLNLMLEMLWLRHSRKLILLEDFNTSLLSGGQVNGNIPHDSAYVIRTSKYDQYTICYSKDNKRLGCCYSDLKNEESQYLGYFNPHELYNNQTSVSKELYSIICGILNSEINLEEITNTITIKKGKVKTRKYNYTPAERAAFLVSTHSRSEHTRTLHHPRFYENGIVPTDEKLLRQIPVKGSIVNRDIKKYKVV